MFYEIHTEDLSVKIADPLIRFVFISCAKCYSNGGLPDYDIIRQKIDDSTLRDTMILVEVNAQNFFYEHYGEGIAQISGFSMQGKHTEEFGGSIGEFFTSCYRASLDNRQMMLTFHRAALSVQVHMWERLILPCTHEGTNRLVVINRPRQFQADLLQMIIETSPVGILAVRAVRNADEDVVDGIILATNRRCAQFLGYDETKAQDGFLTENIPFVAQTNLWNDFVDVINDRVCKTVDIELPSRSGVRRCSVSLSPLADGLVATLQDVTAQYLSNAALRHAAETDPLTEIANRRQFDGVLKSAFEETTENAPGALIVADLDRFKSLNDAYGHDFGDIVIQRFAMILRDCVRSSDLCARIGGEEFALLLCTTDPTAVFETADRVRRLLAQQSFVEQGKQVSVTASFGTCLLGAYANERDAYKAADNALYAAKSNGRNQVVSAGVEPLMLRSVCSSA